MALTRCVDSAIRDLSSIQLLADLLPERVGSLLSLNALREDLEASHRALTHWMDVLERLYYVVRLRPFENSRVRSLRKMLQASRDFVQDEVRCLPAATFLSALV